MLKGHVKYLPTPTLTLTTLSAQITDGTLTGEGSIALETAPEGTLLKQFQQLTTAPFNYGRRVARLRHRNYPISVDVCAAT